MNCLRSSSLKGGSLHSPQVQEGALKESGCAHLKISDKSCMHPRKQKEKREDGGGGGGGERVNLMYALHVTFIVSFHVTVFFSRAKTIRNL